VKAILVLGFLALFAGFARAEAPQGEFGVKAVLKEVGFDQKLGESVPANASFLTEEGKTVRLGDLLGDKPVVLVPVYYECPALCTLTLNGTLRTLRALSFTAGNEFKVVAFSFNPRETPELAAKKKKTYTDEYRRPGSESGWTFLTGKESDIRLLTDAIGFRYTYDERTKTYAHAGGLLVLTPKGRIARVFFGSEFSPRDLKFALMEASEDRIGTATDQALMFCYQYDPLTGTYGVAIRRLLVSSGILTVLALAAFIGVSLRRETRRKNEQAVSA
jgi:protein SCO1/2